MERHHALVYLSPAGDAEFGEVKPFMVDLRGIEEIARLHLLHNVQGRRPTPPTDGGGHGSDGGSPENGPGPNGGVEGIIHLAGEHPEMVELQFKVWESLHRQPVAPCRIQDPACRLAYQLECLRVFHPERSNKFRPEPVPHVEKIRAKASSVSSAAALSAHRALHLPQ